MNTRAAFPILLAWLLAPLAEAATKDEYRAASVKGLRELTERRAKGTVRRVLDGAKDQKIVGLGRGEIMLNLLTGPEAVRADEMLKKAADFL